MFVHYSKKEELLNTITHGLGLVLSVISLIYLINKSIIENNVMKIVGFSIYGICLSMMFLSSTLYHGVENKKIKKYLRLCDHCAIFLCIAGTYTPIALLAYKNKMGFLMLSVIWILAIFGISLKLFSFKNNKFSGTEKMSLALYVLMGWISILFIKDIILNIGIQFFIYILFGGVMYSIGVYFYKNKKIKYNHTIWHLFILAGAMSMNIGIIKYL